MSTKTWRKIRDDRYEREDNAVVKYDHAASTNTSKPWLLGHRGWIAYGPGPEENNCLYWTRKDSLMHMPRKYKTPEAAMVAVDKLFK